MPACVPEATAAVFWARADAVGVGSLTTTDPETGRRVLSCRSCNSRGRWWWNIVMKEGYLWKERRVGEYNEKSPNTDGIKAREQETSGQKKARAKSLKVHC